MSTANGDDGPSFFARYIDEPEKPRPQQTKKTTERRPRNAGFVAQGEKDAKIKSFLMDILAKGPVPTTTIQKRGAAQGFTRKQLWRAKGIIGAVAFKKGMGIQGRWFWARAQHNPNTIKGASKNDAFSM